MALLAHAGVHRRTQTGEPETDRGSVQNLVNLGLTTPCGVLLTDRPVMGDMRAMSLSTRKGCGSGYSYRRTDQARVAQVSVPQDGFVQIGPT